MTVCSQKSCVVDCWPGLIVSLVAVPSSPSRATINDSSVDFRCSMLVWSYHTWSSSCSATLMVKLAPHISRFRFFVDIKDLVFQRLSCWLYVPIALTMTHILRTYVLVFVCISKKKACLHWCYRKPWASAMSLWFARSGPGDTDKQKKIPLYNKTV